MKKIIVSKSYVYFIPIIFLVDFLFLYIGIYKVKIPLFVSIPIVCFLFLGFLVYCFIANRFCNVVFFDNQKVYRKGFFFGFKTSIDINKILYIKKISFFKDGTFYCLIDNKHYHTTRTNKYSSIFIPYTEKGYNFIKQFYSGNIPPFK